MKIDKTAVQKNLDLAAEQLDNMGYTDLAEKVDWYNSQLMKEGADVGKIRRALGKVQLESELRKRREAAKKEPTSDKADKAQNAVMQSRRSALKRKIALHRILREKAAQRKKQKEQLEGMKASATPKKEEFQKKLAEDLTSAEQTLDSAKGRIERIKRVQKALSS